MMRTAAGAALLTATLTASALAREGDVERLLTASLDDLLNVPVITATGTTQLLREAPAVVSVITAEDIRLHGYRSVAEALAQVPGFYAVDDYVSWNVGVRGIHPGARAYSRLLKVMIDGQVVAMRSDASNFLGPELINLDAVARIEVVRGPVSAVYGADAFLGVINVITRNDAAPEHRLRVQALADDETGLGLGLLERNGENDWQWLLALAGESVDRSGLSLPTSSPRYANLRAGSPSNGDEAQPRTALARIGRRHAYGQTQLTLHSFRLDAHGEFLDFGVLSHNNRFALRQDSWQLRHDLDHDDDWGLSAKLGYSQGEPDRRERLSLGPNQQSHPARDFGFNARTGAFEARYRPAPAHQLSLGLDVSLDREDTLRVYSINDSSGQRTLLAGTGAERTLRNQGAYLQWSWQPWSNLALTANLRRDEHNVYGGEDHYRLGLVGELKPTLSWKLLYGTSYKAPAALQLYAQPLYAGDAVANPALQPEFSRTLELAWSWLLGNDWLWTANIYWLTVTEKVELLPRGANLQPQNSGRQEGEGLESELHWQPDPHRLSLLLAWQDTDDIQPHPFLGDLVTPTASYPRLILGLDWRYQHANLGGFTLSARHISERRASKSNIQLNLLQPYELAPYQTVDANWSRDLGRHRLGARVSNLFDERYEEPGYNGIDVPGRARTLSLSYSYRF